ncbi:MAG: AMP-binding protein [Dehalococcoidia bacterium]
MLTDAERDEIVAGPTLRERLWRRFAEQAEAPALLVERPGAHDRERWLSYGDLGRLVNRTAHALAAAGAAPGRRVGVMLPNSERFVQVWLALAGLNATMAPINVNLVGAGLRHALLSCDLDLLVVEAALLPAVLAACGEVPPARRTLVHGEDGAGTPDDAAWAAVPGSATLDFGARLATAPETPPPPVAVDPADLALIIHTSGTTGPSKGVMLSRTAQLWHGLNYVTDFARVGPGEVGYTPLPLFHVSAQGFSLGCLLSGAAIAIGVRFSAFSFWESLRRHNATSFNYVGAMIPLLYHRPPRADDADQPAVRAVGSATVPELHEPFERRFGIHLMECYGQSETAGLWLMEPPEGRRIGTVGGPRRWLAATVLREDGTEAADGEEGELALRPAHPLLMTQGYLGDPQATAYAFRDGWYHTGDAAVRDADGFYRFRGRLKEFIRRRGENISAFEIEREALAHPAVREAAAVGVPSALGEEEVKLCVLLHEGASVTPAALDRFLRPRLAAFMRPRYVEVRAEFPRTPTQRVQKWKLREEGVTPATWDRRARRDRNARDGGTG